MTRPSSQGQALAEMALCLPLLILMIMALCQIALIGQAAFLAHLAARSAARAYAVYCQQGPGYGLDMAGRAALVVARRCHPLPQIEVVMESDPDSSPDFTLRVDLHYPLAMPLAKGLLGQNGMVLLRARASMEREDTPAYFKAHPEIERSR
jgi:hypothetical protein